MTSEQKAAYIMAQAALLNAKVAIIARERAQAAAEAAAQMRENAESACDYDKCSANLKTNCHEFDASEIHALPLPPAAQAWLDAHDQELFEKALRAGMQHARDCDAGIEPERVKRPTLESIRGQEER